jgi:D-alanyl-D-alanine carboxypeptidase
MDDPIIFPFHEIGCYFRGMSLHLARGGEREVKTTESLSSIFKTLAVVILCIGQSAAQKGFDPRVVDSYLKPYVASGNFAGSVLIEKGGRIVFEKAYGSANREMRLRNRSTTRYHIASVSMQFTAGAILRLVDQGAISLNTHVNDVVSGVEGGDKITIRDLLLQRSGLSDINDLPDYDDILQRHQTPASLVAKIRGRPLLYAPGSKFLHEEHSAYNLLALIVETETGLPFARAMEKLIFRPAGLSRTFIDDDQARSTADVAHGYQPDGTRGLKPATAIQWSAKAGNASVVTSARDQARWVRELFRGQLLKAASRKEILDTSPRVGYGWFRSSSPRYQETIYSMNGRSPGFASFVLYLPKEQMTVVGLSNIYSSATTTIGYDLAAIALGLPYEPFQPGESALSAEQLKASTGTFRFGADFYQPNAEVSLIAIGSELALRWPSGDQSPLIPLGRDHFKDRSYWEDVSIERDAKGTPMAAVYGRFRGEASRPK